MTLFTLNYSGASVTGSEQREFPELRDALVEANRRVCNIVRRHSGSDQLFRGSLDIEDEDRRTLARVLFTDVQRQIS